MRNHEGAHDCDDDRLLLTIRRHVADDASAEDILQNVFIKIHTRIDTLRENERLERWVYQIVRNAITDYRRRQRPLAALPEELAAPDDPDEDDTDVARQLVSFVRATITSLPEPYREALLPTEYGGLTQQQLAERSGLSLSGAKSRVQRAREKVKGLLLACCHIELDRRGGILDEQPLCDACTCGCCVPGDEAGRAPA